MRNPYHKSMHRSRVIPVFECIVPTFCQILKIAKTLDITAFQRFNRPIGRTIALKASTRWNYSILTSAFFILPQFLPQFTPIDFLAKTRTLEY